MNTGKLNDKLQLLASVGVIVGLGLVAYELRQEANLTRAEMGSDTFSSVEELTRSGQSEATVRARARASEKPEELTLEDQIILDNYYWEAFITHLQREDYMRNRGIFDDAITENDLEWAAMNAAEIILATDHGHAWWEAIRSRVPDNQRNVFDRIVARGVVQSRQEFVSEVDRKLTKIQADK